MRDGQRWRDKDGITKGGFLSRKKIYTTNFFFASVYDFQHRRRKQL